MKVHKCFENEHFKVTVEELDAFKFIATLWDKGNCLEVDRDVEEFETFGGAMEAAFDSLCDILDCYDEVIT